MRRISFFFAALAIVPAVLYFAMRQPASVHSQSLPPAPDGQQFRIAVGLTDKEAKPWKGRITVSGGDILSLEGWRASPADSAGASGDFAFTTKIGLLENQLLPGRPYGQTGRDGQAYRHEIPQGLLLKLKGGEAARVQFESGSGTFSFQTDQIAYGARVPFLDGNASVERLPMEQKLSTANTADDHPAIAISPDGKRWVAWLAYKDKSDGVMVSDGAQVYSVGERGDLHAPAIAADGRGSIKVVWPRNENGGFQIYGSDFRNGAWTKPEALTSTGSSNFWPQLASDGKGSVALVWQGFRNSQSVILSRLWNGKRWSAEQRVSDISGDGPGNCWAPAVAYGGGRIWIAWDSYATGAYQIYAREWGARGPVARVTRITKGDRFSVRPSVVVGDSGKPVVAWEESDALWGKDFAYQVDRRGTVEYTNRRIRVAYLDSGDWNEPAARVEDAVPKEIRRFVQQPQLAMDAAGHLYMT
ncbi:MAG: hypothetical protein M3Y07_12055, partial [Acidobacteriota bacterium]|nr:hypothetical protein [Acidobacteriota bacterium]